MVLQGQAANLLGRWPFTDGPALIAALLLVFLVAATYFFHDFWTFDDPAERQQQTIQFMKNASLVGAMLFIMANGAGAWSLDGRRGVAGDAVAA